MKYKVYMEIEIEAKNKAELDYILEESYSASDFDRVMIINSKNIELTRKINFTR